MVSKFPYNSSILVVHASGSLAALIWRPCLVICDIISYGLGLPWWAQMVKNLPAMYETQILTPGLGRYHREGNDNPFQYFCLENSMDRGAW